MKCYSCGEEISRIISDLISDRVSEDKERYMHDFIGRQNDEHITYRIINFGCPNCNELILGSIDLRNKSKTIGFDITNINETGS